MTQDNLVSNEWQIIHKNKKNKITLAGNFEGVKVYTDYGTGNPLSFAEILELRNDLNKWISEQIDKSVAGYEEAAKQSKEESP